MNRPEHPTSSGTLPPFPPDPRPFGELRLLLSSTPLGTLVHERMANELLQGRTLVLICGDIGLSTDFLVRRAKISGQSPEILLSRLRISRAFTVHQLLATVTRRLDEELERTGADLLFLSGLLPLFADAAIPSKESGRILATLIESLENLSRKGIRTLLPVSLPLPPSRQAISVLSGLFHAATRVETVLPLSFSSSPDGSGWFLPEGA